MKVSQYSSITAHEYRVGYQDQYFISILFIQFGYDI